jgi:D-glycero-alpha-D-manno-heptose-7-phosphate kinase
VPVPATPDQVVVEVPVRVCDVGGWTDTWFAGHGRVCSLAVGPGVTVVATAVAGDGQVTLAVPDLGGRFAAASAPPEHRLLAEAVAEGGAPAGRDVEVSITSAVPPAASLGTSASVCVGVIAALDVLGRGAIRPPGALAAAAHRVEAVRVGRQSGVQDQLAAAHGGANLLEIDYPDATVERVPLTTGVHAALDERLLHVAYGGRHDSSAVHEQVIAELEAEGEGAARLERLRELAGRAHRALVAGDLSSYGEALRAATAAQAELHPALVSGDARTLIELAASEGAQGWKVNGAGGSGGSISILCPTAEARRRIGAEAASLGHVVLDLRIARAGARRR